MKKILGIFACLAVIAALAGYFVVIPQMEEKQAAQVAAFIEGLPGDLKAGSIKVGLLDSKVEVLGLKGDTKYIDGSDMSVDVERIVIAGVNFSAGEGVAPLVGEAVFQNVKLRITTLLPPMGVELPPEMNKPIVQNLALADMTVKGLSGDYGRLRAAVKADSRKDMFDCLGSTFAVAEFSANGYANQLDSLVGPVSMSMKSLSARNAGLLKSGPASCEDLRMSMLGSEVMRIGGMTIASCSMPNVYPALIEAQEQGDYEAMSRALFSAKDGAFVVEGMAMRDIYFKLLLPDPLTINGLGMDFSLAANRLAFKQDVKGMTIPASMYRNLSMEIAQFADYYGQALDIDAVIDADLRWEPGRADMVFNRLSAEDKNLGAGSLSATLYATGEGDSVEEFMDGDAAPYLVKADLMLEDKALLANVFGGEFEAIKAFGLTGEGMESPEDLRRQAVALFEAQLAEMKTEDQTMVAEGLIKLLKAPGRLAVSLSPEAPAALDGLEEGDSALNAKVVFTPAAAESVPAAEPAPASE